MQYTVKKLAQVSGVTIRTLRFYDEIGLLKPAYIAENGYRYYQEKELLLLQQILFFRELGFELKHIQEILGQSDFDKIKALQSHKAILKKNVSRMQTLMKTIDHTINHLEGKTIMNTKDMFHGFDSKQQTCYEEYLVNRFGKSMEQDIAFSKNMVKDWSQADWETSSKEFDAICKKLVVLMSKKATVESPEVQTLIAHHYTWISQFWSPTQASYIGLGQSYTEPEWHKTFTAYHPQLAQFLAAAMQTYAQRNLS